MPWRWMFLMMEDFLFRYACWLAMQMPVEVVLAGEDGVIH